jgi:hypothetical protein
VITLPATNAVNPDLVHAPEDTVVVPCETPPFNTVIVVPSASLLVPLTDVDPAQSGEFTTGVTELLCTVTEDEVELIHFAVAWAVAVMTSPATNAVRPDLVHAPDDTVVVPTETPPL